MDKVSVIICTYNRANSLCDTLATLQRQKVTSVSTFEIVLIDNNSKDHTKQVAQEAAKTAVFPIRYFFEQNQGKSYALNRGIQESKGDYLLFTDDDTLPNESWVENCYLALKNDGVECVGGKVLPDWKGKAPEWFYHPRLHQNFNGIWALLDYGEEPIRSHSIDENFLYGSNIAFKRSVFNEIGLYRTDLGPSGKRLFRGEDTEMMHRYFSKGKAALYSPKVVVMHKVEADRIKLSYARRRRFDGGYSDFYRQDPAARRIPLWYIRECFVNAFKAVGNYLKGNQERGLELELAFWNQFGRITGGLKAVWTKSP